jgi:chaperone required for assembly of F1-ATPase
MTAGADNGGKAPGAEGAGDVRPRRSAPKRFYKAVTVGPSPTRVEGGVPRAFRVLLDGNPARTPANAELDVPTRALAEAIAAEWAAQGERVDAGIMPLTRLANTAIDGVATRLHEVRADIFKFAASDLVCYRAEGPEPLVRRQAQHWDPVLAWGRDALAARFEVATGLMPVAQPEHACAAVAATLEGLDAFHLAALHVMTALTGSALLVLAHARGALTLEAAWTAAHVDEDWQVSQWGEDPEAVARRARRWGEMQAASRLLGLLAEEDGIQIARQYEQGDMQRRRQGV